MCVFEGYLFEIERTYNSDNNQKIRDIYWFKSIDNKLIGNDGSIILISEPIKNFEGLMKEEVLKNFKTKNYYLKYENNKWILTNINQ